MTIVEKKNGNSSFVTKTWLIATLVMMIGFGSGTWIWMVESRFAEASTIRLGGFSRLSSVETVVSGITSRLDKIEVKLDKALSK